MRLDLAAIGNEPYRKLRPSKDIIIRNRRAAAYSEQVETKRVERRSYFLMLLVLVLIVICCGVCGVH